MVQGGVLRLDEIAEILDVFRIMSSSFVGRLEPF